MSVVEVRRALIRAHHEEWVRVVAALTRRFGDLDIAEDATAEAFATAVVRWPVDGVPPNPGAWLSTTAQRNAIVASGARTREMPPVVRHQRRQVVAPSGPFRCLEARALSQRCTRPSGRSCSSRSSYSSR